VVYVPNPNPKNFPRVDFAIAFTADANSSDTRRWTNLSERLTGAWSISRGRQYELDQFQTGELRATLQNTDGALDPDNTASPFYGYVTPGREARMVLTWPNTANLLTRGIATCGDVLASSDFLDTEPADGDSATTPGYVSGSTFSTAHAWQDSRSVATTIAAGTTSGTVVGGWAGASTASFDNTVTTGRTYTFSVYVTADLEAGAVAPEVVAQLVYTCWSGTTTITRIAGTTVATGGVWTRIDVTGDVPDDIWAYVSLNVALKTTQGGTGAATLYIDGLQLEEAEDGPSQWILPGENEALFYGMVERWPQVWNYQGTYGLSQIIVSDHFLALSNIVLPDAFTGEVLYRSPQYFYPLNDPDASVSCVDVSGNQASLPVTDDSLVTVNPTTGVINTQVKFGTSIDATDKEPYGEFYSFTGLAMGATETVATFTNPADDGTGAQAETYLELDAVANLTPGPPEDSDWTRMIAFRVSVVPTQDEVMWMSYPSTHAYSNQGYFEIYASSDSSVTIKVFGYNGVGFTHKFTGSGTAYASMCDGDWHLVTVGLSADGTFCRMSMDGVIFEGTSGSDCRPIDCRWDAIGAVAYDNGFGFGYAGDLGHVAQWQTLLTQADIAAIYTAWRIGWYGQTAAARAASIVQYANYLGPTVIDSSATTAMGVASDLSGAYVLDALNLVAATENGAVYMSRGGVLELDSATKRYFTPVAATLGEAASDGEWPYEADIGLDFDDQHLYNVVQVQQQDGLTQATFDVTSRRQNYPRIYQITINAATALQVYNRAQLLLAHYKDAHTRIATIRLHPAANPDMWPTALRLGISSRVEVRRRPPSPAATISIDGFIESVNWNVYDSPGEAYVEYQLSPGFLYTFWIVTGLRTTLASSAAAGDTTLSIDALADAATNPLESALCPGLGLVLDFGTANQETVVIDSIAATSAGYSTGTLTLTAPLVYPHSAGAQLGDVLSALDAQGNTITSEDQFDYAALLGQSTRLSTA
jgi:hypothetical protein